jgi:tetratricopeptide (TPR) repeat protein
MPLLLAMAGAVFAQESPEGLGAKAVAARAAAWELVAGGKGDEAQARFDEACALRTEALALLRATHGGGDRVQVAAALNELGNALSEAGRRDEALRILEEGLAMRTRLSPGDTPDVAESLHDTAACLESLRRTAEALPRYEAATAMLRRLVPGDDWRVSLCLGNVAQCMLELDRAGEALPVFEESLAMRRRIFNGDHPLLAQGLNHLATCLTDLGRWSEALPLYEESLSMCRRLYGVVDRDLAGNLLGVGWCLAEVGRVRDGLPLCEESVLMYRRLHKGDHPDVARSLCIAARCLMLLGRFEDALTVLQESGPMCKRLYKGDHAEIATNLENMAACLSGLRRAGDALPLYDEALAMYRRLHKGDDHAVATTLEGYASCLFDVGRTQDALPLFQECLAIRRRLRGGDHRDVGMALIHVAGCLFELRRYADALPFSQEVLAMCRRLHEADHPDVAATLNNAGAALQCLGRHAEALPFFQESLAMGRRLEAGGQRTETCLRNLGDCLLALGRDQEALQSFEEAVSIVRRADRSDRHEFLAHLAHALLLEGSASRAAELLEEAVEQIESLRAEAMGLTESERAAYFQGLKRHSAFELAVLAQRILGRDGEALRYLERGRTRSLLDLLDRSRLDPLAEVRAQAEARGDTTLLQEIANVSFALVDADKDVSRLTHAIAARQPKESESTERQAELAPLMSELVSARRKRENVLRRIAWIVRSQLAVAAPADAAALQRLAGHDGRVLVYAVSENGATLFLAPPAGGAVRAFSMKWPGGGAVTAASLAEKVAEHGRRIEAGRDGGRGVAGVKPENAADASWSAGHTLFQALVPQEVWTDIRKAGIVYVVADGALQRLAFESLPVDEGGGAFWLDAGPPVAYGPSGSALLWSRAQGDRQRSQGRLDEAVVLGDPMFKRDAGVPPGQGVVVLTVADDGQAKRVGIEPGDVIVAYGGKEIAGAEALVAETKEARGEQTVALWRAGERREVKVAPGPLGVQLSREPVADALQRLRAADPVVLRASAERSGALSRYGELVPLPGTRREAEAIAKALGSPGPPPMKVTMLLGEDATAPNLRRAAPRARYLHIATHGLADETEFASYSSLALTLPRAPTAEDDGFLSLADVLSGWRGALARCELVVLSACETQRGYEQRDEGVYALPVGFLYAGAPSVIGSLWRVDDASTAELFADFYARLRGSGGRDKLVAFTEARKALKRKRPEPYFWAPFVYVGDPR